MIGYRNQKIKPATESLAEKWREAFRPRRKKHDPMLVMNMSVFNFESGWRRTFDPIKVHENGPA